MTLKILLAISFINVFFAEVTETSWLPFWRDLSPAITMVLIALAGWITMMTRKDVAEVKVEQSKNKEELKAVAAKVDKSAEKVDAVAVASENLKVAMNGITKERVESAKTEAIAVATLDERQRAATEQLKIDAAVNAATSTVTVSAGNVAPDIGDKVDKVNDTVDVIDHNVTLVKGEVLKDVSNVVKQAVKDAKEKPK